MRGIQIAVPSLDCEEIEGVQNQIHTNLMNQDLYVRGFAGDFRQKELQQNPGTHEIDLQRFCSRKGNLQPPYLQNAPLSNEAIGCITWCNRLNRCHQIRVMSALKRVAK